MITLIVLNSENKIDVATSFCLITLTNKFFDIILIKWLKDWDIMPQCHKKINSECYDSLNMYDILLWFQYFFTLYSQYNKYYFIIGFYNFIILTFS